VHPSIVSLKEKVRSENRNGKYDVDLTYITSRGHWYFQSWKGDEKKSGGIATNIGVHFFDMLHFIFGELQENVLHHSTDATASGFLEYEKARVRWFLSVDNSYVPEEAKAKGLRTFRSITVDGEEIEFSGGFADLHNLSYQRILAGEGFGLEENRVAIETVSAIRNASPIGVKGDYHPFLANII
jgi:UDP-N-acetyl-2-amino-2-deoxyglucuronate dehydrogenase